MAVFILYVDKEGNPRSLEDLFHFDHITAALLAIDHVHHEIHEAHTYTASKVITLPAGGSANILISTGKVARHEFAHIIYQVISDDVLTVNFFEEPDYAGGNSLVTFNRNREHSTEGSMVTLTDSATDSGGGTGTLIWTFKAGANKTVTASESERFEFILKEDTKYLLQAIGAQNDIVTFLLDWYEHGEGR